MKRQRRFLTLIELMIVIAIIGLVGGIAAFNLNKAMTEQRFRVEVASVVNQLRLAQNLMLILDQDVKVKFTEGAKGKEIDYWLEMQCPALYGWDKELMRRPPPLKTIHVVDFDPDQKESKTAGELELQFMSGGTVMSRGILWLSTAEHPNDPRALERYVCLQGSPAPINALSGSVPKVSCLEEQSSAFEHLITQITVQEIHKYREAATTMPGSQTTESTPQQQ